MLHSLQCCNNIPVVDETLHFLGHHVNKTPDEIRLDLANWIPNDLDWIRSVCSILINKRKQDFDGYINSLIKENNKIDEIGLLLIARLYSVHIGVIMQDQSVWTTHVSNTLSCCGIILAYLGKHKFAFTIPT